MEPSNTTSETETLGKMERMLRIQNAAMHLEMMMQHAREVQTLLDQKVKDQQKANA